MTRDMKLAKVESDFQQASDLAMDLAQRTRLATMVRRSPSGGFEVRVDPSVDVVVLTALNNQHFGPGEIADYDPYEFASDQSEQIQEFSSDQDDLQRSDSEGWFYPD